MKIVKTLLCVLTSVSLQINAQTFSLTSDQNVLDKINIQPGSKWSYDGGIFKETSNGLYLKNNGEHKLLIKSPDGSLSVATINITSENNSSIKVLNNIIIDNKGPELNYRWNNVITKNNKTIAGPLSQLSWDFNEKIYTQQVYINKTLVPNIDSPMTIVEGYSHIAINAVDKFNNALKTEVDFSTDFIGPEIKWNFITPKIKIDDQWYIGKDASINLTAADAKTILVNGSRIDSSDMPLTVNNNSQITAIDYLGNSSVKNISWIEDSEPPIITVLTSGKEYVNPNKLNVKVNQKIQIIVTDIGTGVQSSEYLSSKRKWQPLLNKFIFVGTGLYAIKIRSTDKIGNEILTKIVFKITL